jgi:hypothetical protein
MRHIREVAIAAGLAVLALLLAFGAVNLQKLKAGGAVQPAASAPATEGGIVPWLPIPPSPNPTSTISESRAMSVQSAAVTIGGTVTEVRPLLVPAWLPDGAQATVSAHPSGFTVEYRAGTSSVALMIASPRLGLPPSNGSERTFRGTLARYELSDPEHAEAGQFLTWTEPGASPANPKGVPYFLKVGGLTADKFWRVANSIGPIPALPRLCQAADLRAAFGRGNGAGGHLISSFYVTNHSPSPCIVRGYPRMELLLENGTAIDSPQRDGNPGPADSPVAVLLAASTAAQPGEAGTFPLGSAAVIFEWGYCPGPQPAVSRIRLTLPDGQGTLTFPARSDVDQLRSSRCDAPGHGLTVGPFQMTGGYTASGASVRGSLNLPQRVQAGQPLRYTVTLTNTSTQPVVLDPCPSYIEILGQKIVWASYQLNCAAARPIPPGGSLTFAMQLDLPASLPAGAQGVRWVLQTPFLAAADGSLTLSAKPAA